jgi:phage tail sheath protein FI
MPVTPTYPGVYIEEVPSGVRTIIGVATSIAAFVDFFPRGPLNEAVRIFSFADFEREFGGLDTRSEASYAIREFFLNGGTEALVVRVASGSFSTAEVTLTRSQPAPEDIVRVRAGRFIRGASVDNPGEWGNALRVEVDYDTTDPDEFFSLTVAETERRDGRPVVRQTETFRNLTMRPAVANNAIEVVNQGSRLVQLEGMGAVPDPPFRPDATGTLSALLPAPPPNLPPDSSQVDLTITVNPGNLSRPVNLNYGLTPPIDYPSLRPLLEAGIRAAEPTNPLFSGATVQLARTRFRILLGRTGPVFDAAATAEFTGATADALALSTSTDALLSPQQNPLAGGADGDLPTEAALRGVEADKTGLYALEDADLFNTLCIPRAADLDAIEMRAVYTEAESYCRTRRAFLLIDIPGTTDSLDGMQTWLGQNDQLRHSNAAVYFPRVRVADPLNQNRLRSSGASGTMAGLFARTDASRGVWKAPAGIEARLRNVQELDYLLTDPQNGVLNPLGVNCLRTFPVYGTVAWGARTLDGADVLVSDWKYIPVRRLALFLEESLYRGTKWVVFEPNDEPLWAQIRLNVGAFMHTLFRQGAFQGATPREAYLVKCDSETTTQADINAGIVNIVVGFAPLKPAEFVIIKIQQLAGQIPT